LNIFLAGIHGVGKTFLAAQLPRELGITHTSASKLIREELARPNWGTDKRVGDVDSNQIALVQAVRRHNENGARLLLDGHFVLLDSVGNYVYLEVGVFRSLNLQAAVLLEAPPDIIAERIHLRDGREVAIADIERFAEAERIHAKDVCDCLGIDLVVLDVASPDALLKVIEQHLSG
jgi:adenylate kinase